MQHKSFKIQFVLLLIFIGNIPAMVAQCAMCRAALESEGSAKKAEAVNDGIVYLMIFPYLLVAVIAYMVYKTGKNLIKR